MTQPEARAGGGASAATALHQIRPDWLKLRSEAALLPDLPIIDAHIHLWDMPGNRYLLPEFLADATAGHAIVASVYVQSGIVPEGTPPELRATAETAFAARIAAESARTAVRVADVIVGPIDLASGTATGAALDAQIEAADGRFRGVRDLVHWHSDPDVHRVSTVRGLLASQQAQAALAEIEARDLVLDLWVYHTQLDEIAAVARAFPNLTVVLNHAGTPLGCGRYATEREAVFAEWRAGMSALAALPNVRVKLGGLAMRFSGFRFAYAELPPSSDMLAQAFGPVVETCIALFGANRCMFESNFPVDKTNLSYGVLWNAFKRLTASASEAERRQLFAGTAAEVYRMSAVD